MEKLKTIFLKTLRGMANFVSIAAIIMTILTGTLAIFYDQIANIFASLGWSQEQLTWATVSLGGLGTAGVLTTQVSRGLKAALLVSKSEQERAQITFEREINSKIKESELRISQMEKEHAGKMALLQRDNSALQKEVIAYQELLTKQTLFDRAQAQKYIDAPDNLISPEAKRAYQEYLDATSEV